MSIARAPTTTDAFNAIAEPRRRELLSLLVGAPAEGCERDVTWMVSSLGWPQPQVSKHLGVLRKVGLVSVSRRGKRRMYRVNAEHLRPVYDWVKTYERFWDQQLNRIKDRAERVHHQTQGVQHPPGPGAGPSDLA